MKITRVMKREIATAGAWIYNFSNTHIMMSTRSSVT